MSKVLTTADVCERYGISAMTLYRWRLNKGFPAPFDGGRRYFKKDVKQWERNLREQAKSL